MLQTREAEARRLEMLQAIGRRNGDSSGPPRPRVQTMFEPSPSSASIMSNGGGSPRSAVPEDSMYTIDSLAEEADQQLEQALRNQESVTSDIRIIVQLLHQVGLGSLNRVYSPRADVTRICRRRLS